MTNQQKIIELEKNYAVLSTKLENISDVIYQIRDNHLVHLALDIKEVNKTMEDKFGLIDKRLQSLFVTDARQEPGSNLINKVIEYIVIGVVGAALALIVHSIIGSVTINIPSMINTDFFLSSSRKQKKKQS